MMRTNRGFLSVGVFGAGVVLFILEYSGTTDPKKLNYWTSLFANVLPVHVAAREITTLRMRGPIFARYFT